MASILGINRPMVPARPDVHVSWLLPADRGEALLDGTQLVGRSCTRSPHMASAALPGAAASRAALLDTPVGA